MVSLTMQYTWVRNICIIEIISKKYELSSFETLGKTLLRGTIFPCFSKVLSLLKTEQAPRSNEQWVCPLIYTSDVFSQ